jgi:ATP-dependent helicase/nuclease subunit A
VAELFTFPGTPEIQTPSDDTLPPDFEAREQALDVQQSWIVEAPAGSGKTGLLIQRYLKLLADQSVDEPEQVLAITFTVKATTEIRDRIIGQLQRAAGADLPKTRFDRETRAFAQKVMQRDAQLNWQLLKNPHRLRIRTIDSLCAEIASSLPVLSGSGGTQSPVADATLLYREAAQRTLMQLGGPDAALDDALRTVLLHRDGNLRDCERLLMEMLALRDQWGALVPLEDVALSDAYLDNTVLPQLQRSLEQAVCAGLDALAQTLPNDFLHALSSLANSLAEIEPYQRAYSPIAICRDSPRMPSTNATDLPHWKALLHLLVTPSKTLWRKSFAKNVMHFETTQSQKQSIRNLLEEVEHREDIRRAIERLNHLPPAVYPPEQWLVAKALFRILRRALVELQIVFAERGECDFAELGLLARTALRHDSASDGIAAALGMKLQHLLVDEMQDTSTSQYELIELLTQGWDGHSQTVFLVGDPKQSIYLFRKARVERFVRTMLAGQLGDLPMRPLQLTANFRSQGRLVEEFNQAFSAIFPRETRPTNPEDVPYVEATPVRAPSTYARGIVWHSYIAPQGLSSDEKASARRRQSTLDAQSIRSIIQQWRARPLPESRIEPWKIAILTRSRNHLIDIVAALNCNSGDGPIPFRAVDIEALGTRQEVLDLYALTRALLHPADRVAWLAILRAPWCGLCLAELHMLTGTDNPESADRAMQDVLAERAHLLSEESCNRLARLWPIFTAAVEQRSHLTTAQLVERTWRSLGGDTYLQSSELANARRYLQLLDEVEEQAGRLDQGLLKQRLDDLYAQPNTSENAVDLMTIHKSKGLEWDLVIVPELHKSVPPNTGRLLTWSEIDSEDEATSVVLAPIKSKGEASKELNYWLQNIYKAREVAEQKRLFYVVSTRAREELHLFATAETSVKGEIHPPGGSLLHTAWPAAKKYFAPPTAVGETVESAFVVPSDHDEEEFIGDLAAGGEVTKRPMLQRLPLGFDPQKRFAASAPLASKSTEVGVRISHFERPEGSFEARAFGNTVHTFLELLAKQLENGASAEALRHETARWSPRITALLRANGLPPSSLNKLVHQVQTALINSLTDADGFWVLAAQNQASSEYSLTSWSEQRTSVRLDRVFRAGMNPHASGQQCLWIIDYKTTTHGREAMDKFLEGERTKYGPQMETYASMMKLNAEPGNIRVGLYYPMLPKLIWWTPLA